MSDGWPVREQCGRDAQTRLTLRSPKAQKPTVPSQAPRSLTSTNDHPSPDLGLTRTQLVPFAPHSLFFLVPVSFSSPLASDGRCWATLRSSGVGLPWATTGQEAGSSQGSPSQDSPADTYGSHSQVSTPFSLRPYRRSRRDGFAGGRQASERARPHCRRSTELNRPLDVRVPSKGRQARVYSSGPSGRLAEHSCLAGSYRGWTSLMKPDVDRRARR